MIREGHEDVKFFTGIEVEHTPALGLKTLFVVGVQPVQEIQDWLDDFASYEDTAKHIKHIYFGANMSFPKCDVNAMGIWAPWEKMVQHFLDQDYLCTLDIDVTCAEGLLEGVLCDYANFIPMLSVKIPYIRLLNYNTTVKIDDKDFRATNPGVWCHNLHNLLDREQFTDWSKYTKDKPL